MAVIMAESRGREKKKLDTIVDVGPYNGVFGTMWSIVRDEGGSSEQAAIAGQGGAPAVRRKKAGERAGQGMEGLWRGWRVGMWGLVGVWGAAAMGGVGGSGGEF